MISYFHSFIHLFFIGFIALFPVVNPIGTSFMVNPYFSDLTINERIRASKRIAIYAFCICVVTMFTGHWILELFGLTVPVVKLAGGIMICKIGWEFLSSDKTSEPVEEITNKLDGEKTKRLNNELFYPITFPMTAGAGTISVLFTLSAHAENENINQYILNTGALLISILCICVLVFFFYVNANRFINFVGSHNEKIINRLMAFLIFCVGLQIAVGGIMQLLKG